MEWVRAADDGMATWTTVDNIIIDDDLSCRALGLLLRWLRRPPGVAIDTINQMIDRAKKDGRKSMEGRDALYSASYELERHGYLVRELTTAPNGQHTWRVVVYARPVPPERRSKPEDRARSEGSPGRKTAARNMPKAPARTPTKGQGRTKSDKATPPVPGNPEPDADGAPIPGKPDSVFQEASFKDSVKDSLSSSDSSSAPCGPSAPEGGASGGEERKSSTKTAKKPRAPRKQAARPVEPFPHPRPSSEPTEGENDAQEDADGLQVCNECWSTYTPVAGQPDDLCANCC